nr:C Jun amino terminal kinase interacting protein [Hymenolepis microstoma]
MNSDRGVNEAVSEASKFIGSRSTQDENFSLLSSSEVVADLTALSGEVQAIAHLFNSEFEAILAMEADSDTSCSGSKIVQRLVPTVVTVLEQLDEFFKDYAAYKAEVFQLRDENEILTKEIIKVKSASRNTEDILMQIEEQFENERKTLNEALAQNETHIRFLEMKTKNTEEQLARMEQKEVESMKESSKLHERINELLRSHAELSDSIKNSSPISAIALAKPRDSAPNRLLNNAFDTTSDGLGFDELSAMEGDLSLPPEDDLADEMGYTHGPSSDFDAIFDLAGMRKEVNNLIRENMELMETKNALNIVKDDLLLQRDSLKADKELLKDAVKQLTEKQTLLQVELVKSDEILTTARTEIETLKAQVAKLKERSDKPSATRSFTKAEMVRLISDRNYYKERFFELREAIKLMETLRASQRGHPELLNDLPPTVTDVQMHSSPHHQFKTAFGKLLNLISLPRLDFGLDATGDILERQSEESANASKSPPSTSTVPTFHSQQWIKIYQSAAATPVFGWVRGFGRVRQGKSESSTAKNPASLFSPVAYPVPKKCRSIGRSTLRIELTAALSVPSPLDDDCTQHLWLIGRGAASEEAAGLKKSKNVGKLYIFDPLQLNDALVSMDLVDDFLPISAALFSVAGAESSSPLADSGRYIVKDYENLQTSKTPVELLNSYRVLIAASDGRFIVCATAPNRDGVSKGDSWKVVFLSTFKLANPGESATSIVTLGHRICMGVLNSTGSNQLMTLKWCLELPDTPPLGSNINLNRVLRATALQLPNGEFSSGPSGPLLLSAIFSQSFCCLGTVGGGVLHRFDINADAFVGRLALPSQTPCLHAIAVGNDENEEGSTSNSRKLIWLAVSGLSPPTPKVHRESNVESSNSDGDNVYLGPLSRLLSVCAEKHIFLHNIDLTSVLSSMIDKTGVQDPVDLTVSRLFVQGSECIWFATRCGLIGRFLCAFLLNNMSDSAASSPTEVLNQEAISLSCHAYRRPVSALIAIKNQEESKEEDSSSTNPGSFLVVAVGHDYAYLPTSSPASRAYATTPSLVTAINQRIQGSSGAHAIVWSVST